eukprot:1531995-Pleurochrysis_carterae.AAC.2
MAAAAAAAGAAAAGSTWKTVTLDDALDIRLSYGATITPALDERKQRGEVWGGGACRARGEERAEGVVGGKRGEDGGGVRVLGENPRGPGGGAFIGRRETLLIIDAPPARGESKGKAEGRLKEGVTKAKRAPAQGGGVCGSGPGVHGVDNGGGIAERRVRAPTKGMVLEAASWNRFW